jgi:hypothetical protein
MLLLLALRSWADRRIRKVECLDRNCNPQICRSDFYMRPFQLPNPSNTCDDAADCMTGHTDNCCSNITNRNNRAVSIQQQEQEEDMPPPYPGLVS